MWRTRIGACGVRGAGAEQGEKGTEHPGAPAIAKRAQANLGDQGPAHSAMYLLRNLLKSSKPGGSFLPRLAIWQRSIGTTGSLSGCIATRWLRQAVQRMIGAATVVIHA